MLIHLKSGFTCNDQGYQKFPSCIRGKGNYTLWRIVPNSQILSKDEIETISANVRAFPSKAYSIQYPGIDFIYFLLHYCRDITYKRHPAVGIQWSIQKDPWSKKVSESKYDKTFSSPYSARSYSTDCQSSQFTTKETFFHRMSTNQRYIRFRPNSTYSLWKTAKSKSWIQSKETRQKMLLPVSLFRIQPSRVLAWGIEFWEYQSYNFSNTFPERMHSQITKERKKNSCQSRLRLLRPQVYRIFRRKRDRLYNRSKSHQPDTSNNSSNKISPLQKGLGSSRVLLSTNDPFSYQVEKDPSFCGPTSPIAGRSRRNSSAKSFYNKRIWLQNSFNQSQIKTKTRMEFPQSESEGSRTEYQRTKTQLSINKDPNSELYSKCCLSSNASLLIQYCQLVQTPMSSKRVSLQDIKDYSPEFDIGTSEIDQNRRQKCTQVPSRLSISKIILSTYGKNRKYKNLKNLSRLKNIVSSETH